ncbi:hypothetical protein JXB41_07780 [Candidatus Woesearchaeota archaeon]|nr:hypothetical protein [Candidatus Woesearchaeota archaeon]
MKKMLILLLILTIVALAGCQKAQDKIVESQIEKNTGMEADVQSNDGSVTITTEDEEGTKTEITANKGDGESWCQEGAEWKMTQTGEQDANAQWRIVGIVTSGKYEGYCHVRYTVDSDETQMDMDYYFDEDGSGYQVMELNGQTYETEWHS